MTNPDSLNLVIVVTSMLTNYGENMNYDNIQHKQQFSKVICYDL